MKYLLDTNIILHIVRDSQQYKNWNQTYKFFKKSNRTFTSIINRDEIESLANQLNWGDVKRQRLFDSINQTEIIDLYEEIVYAYAQIDAYSQNKLFNYPLPKGLSARNMGKNDIWLAATAHVTGCTFVTTDHDFDHLQGVYLNLLRL